MKGLLSLVVPVFNEEAVLEEFYRRAKAVLSQLDNSHELVFVDDGSRDQSLEILYRFQTLDSCVRVVRFSRNFGHQNALMAGLDHAQGDAVVLMDADLQDPPELIAQMIKQFDQGFDVVYAVRSRRAGESFFKKITASVFYRLLRWLSGVDIPIDTGDFRLLSRPAVNALQSLPERTRFLRGLVSWVGFRQTGVLFDRSERAAGETKFTFFKMLRFALDGITSFSHAPLRFVTVAGFVCFAGSLALLGWAVFVKLFTDRGVRGWASLIGVVVLLGGLQLLALGVIGEYIARVFDESKHRPLYIVQEKRGFTKSH